MQTRWQSDHMVIRFTILFFLLAILIISAGYLYYKWQKEQILQDKREDIAAVADLKVQQIVNWRRERMGDAEVAYQNHVFARRVKDFLRNPRPELQKEIRDWMKALKVHLQI